MSSINHSSCLTLYGQPNDNSLIEDYDTFKALFPDLFESNIKDDDINNIFNYCYYFCSTKFPPVDSAKQNTQDLNISSITASAHLNEHSSLFPKNAMLTRAMLLEHCILSAINTLSHFLHYEYLLNPRYAYSYLSADQCIIPDGYKHANKGKYKVITIKTDKSNGSVPKYIETLEKSNINIFFDQCKPNNTHVYIPFSNYNFALYLLRSSRNLVSVLMEQKNQITDSLHIIPYDFNSVCKEFKTLTDTFNKFSQKYCEEFKNCQELAPKFQNSNYHSLLARIGYIEKAQMLFKIHTINFLYEISEQHYTIDWAQSEGSLSSALIYPLLYNPLENGSYGMEYLLHHTRPVPFRNNIAIFAMDEYRYNSEIFIPIMEKIFFIKLIAPLLPLTQASFKSMRELLNKLLIFVKESNQEYNQQLHNKTRRNSSRKSNIITEKANEHTDDEMNAINYHKIHSTIPSFNAFFSPLQLNMPRIAAANSFSPFYRNMLLRLTSDCLFAYHPKIDVSIEKKLLNQR